MWCSHRGRRWYGTCALRAGLVRLHARNNNFVTALNVTPQNYIDCIVQFLTPGKLVEEVKRCLALGRYRQRSGCTDWAHLVHLLSNSRWISRHTFPCFVFRPITIYSLSHFLRSVKNLHICDNLHTCHNLHMCDNLKNRNLCLWTWLYSWSLRSLEEDEIKFPQGGVSGVY